MGPRGRLTLLALLPTSLSSVLGDAPQRLWVAGQLEKAEADGAQPAQKQPMLDSLPSPTLIPAFALCSIHTSSLSWGLFPNLQLLELGSLGTLSSLRESPESTLGAQPLLLATCSSLLPWLQACSQALLRPAAWALPSIHHVPRFSQNACPAGASLPPWPCHGIVWLQRDTSGGISRGKPTNWETEPRPQTKKLLGQRI